MTIDEENIEKIYHQLIENSSEQKKFNENLIKLNNVIKKIKLVSYRKCYNFNEKEIANGFVSFLKLLEIYGEICLKFNKQNEMIPIEFVNVSFALIRLTNLIEIFAENDDHQDNLLSNKLKIIGIIENVDHLQDLHLIYNKTVHNFWLYESMRKQLFIYINLVVYRFNKMNWFRNIISLNFDYLTNTFVQCLHNMDLPLIKGVWNISEGLIYRKIIPFLIYGFQPSVQKTIFIKRMCVAEIINDPNGKLKIINYEPNENCFNHNLEKVRARYLRNNSFKHSTNNALILHFHGGGFITTSPDSHEIYLRDWARRLPGIPIISLDYGLSPENKCPTALQQALDTYFYLTSDSAEVIELIGFKPDDIILVGDSAGALLILGLTAILNDLRQTLSFIKMPKKLLAIYPAILLNPVLSPSRCFTSIDTLLSLTCLLSACDGYFESKLVENDIEEKNKPWFKRKSFHERLNEIETISNDPYLSVYYYKHFNTLTDVKLSIVTSEFDPLLDDAIVLSQLWRGEVTLDVVKKLPHGFLNLRLFCKESEDAGKICFYRLTN